MGRWDPAAAAAAAAAAAGGGLGFGGASSCFHFDAHMDRFAADAAAGDVGYFGYHGNGACWRA